MATNTLNSPHIIRLLDRLFAEADASEPALDAMRQSDASPLITSKTGYRQFYGLLKDIPLPVSAVAIICSKDGPTRVRYELDKDGNKIRVCAKCGDTL